MSAPLWILGALDPEMERIQTLLETAGVPWAPAQIAGRRVSAGEAYSADLVDGATHWVECAPAGGLPAGAVSIDHHRPGDPGYGRPPEEFLPASSLGQVCSELARAMYRSWRGSGRRIGLRRGAPGELVFFGEIDGDHPAWRIWDAGTEFWGVIPHDLVLAAASDHCPAAAYQGRCPGVEPDELMRWLGVPAAPAAGAAP